MHSVPMDHVEKVLNQWRQERPDLNVDPMGVIGRFKRLNDWLSEGLSRVYSAHGLNAASFDVLATLRRSGNPYELSPSALIEWTMVTSGTMTNRLDRLEIQALIERRQDPKDGRASVVALSKTGFNLIDKVVTEHVANQRRLLSDLPTETQELLNKILVKWLSKVEKEGIRGG